MSSTRSRWASGVAAVLLAHAPAIAAPDTGAPATARAGEGMTIRQAERLVLHIPFYCDRVRQHMHRANTHGERVLVYRVELADGTVGWGESMHDHAAHGPALVGRNAAGVMNDSHVGFGFQMAAIDAVGRACGVPAWQLLGNKRRARVPIAWWDIDMPPEDLAAEMAEAVRRGYTSAKLKPRPWRDLLAQLDAIEKVVPAGFTVTLDFNGFLLDATQAQALLSRIDSRPVVGGYESPFYLQTDTDGALRLMAALTRPVFEHFNEKVLHARSSDGFVVASNYGPLDSTRQQDALCVAFDRPCWLQMVGTGITAAFVAHLGSVLASARLPSVTCHELWEDDLLTERIEVRNGTMAVPDGPGLGVSVDTNAIARYRVAGPEVPTPQDLYLARHRTVRIHVPAAGDFGTMPTGGVAKSEQVLDFPSERVYYDEFLKGRHPGFRPGTRIEAIETP